MNEKPTKGRQFDTVIVDDPVREIEDPDAHRKAVLKWYEATEASLSDVATLPAASNKEVSPSVVTGRIGLSAEKP